MSEKFVPPEICPVCGEDVLSKAKACPRCGAEEKSRWSRAVIDGIDLPESDFNYEEFVAEEFGNGKPGSRARLLRVLVALLLLVVFVLSCLIRL